MQYHSDVLSALSIARSAGELVRSHYRKVERLTKTHQAATDEAVTIADRQSQALIVRELRKQFPGDGIIGEESETGEDITFECPDPNGRVWVIDPIDGTNNFVAGLDYFAVCIALLDRGEPVAGVVYHVGQNKAYYASRGDGAFVDGERIECLETPMNDQSILVLTANVLDKNGCMPPYACRWLGQTKWKIRCLGSAALDAMLVAAGVAHAAITINGKLWDVAAPRRRPARGRWQTHRPLGPRDIPLRSPPVRRRQGSLHRRRSQGQRHPHRRSGRQAHAKNRTLEKRICGPPPQA